MGAEPLNGLYGLRAFSLLNLGPHSETTGAVDTANQALSTRTGGEVTGAGGVVVVRSVREPQRAAGFHWGRSYVVGDTREHSGVQDRCWRSTGKPGSRYPCCGSLCDTLSQAAGGGAAACSSPELE